MRHLVCGSYGSILTECRRANDLVDLITTSRTVLSSFAKAKTAKLGMLDYLKLYQRKLSITTRWLT